MASFAIFCHFREIISVPDGYSCLIHENYCTKNKKNFLKPETINKLKNFSILAFQVFFIKINLLEKLFICEDM